LSWRKKVLCHVRFLSSARAEKPNLDTEMSDFSDSPTRGKSKGPKRSALRNESPNRSSFSHYTTSDDSNPYDSILQTPSKLNSSGFNTNTNQNDLISTTTQTKSSSLSSRIALFCPFCSSRAIEIGYFGSLMVFFLLIILLYIYSYIFFKSFFFTLYFSL
jgi:hypothetical protein